VKRGDFNKIALDNIYEVGKQQMIKTNLEETRKRKRKRKLKRDSRNVATTDAMYEHLLSDEEDIIINISNIPRSTENYLAAPWRDIIQTTRLEYGL
jgi:hypothetical protein